MNYNDKSQQIKNINISNFGLIIEVIDKNNEKNYFALKIMKNNSYEEYKNEIEVMKKIKNKYIIELKDNFYNEKNEGYYIVLKLSDVDFRKILKKYEPNGLPINLLNKIFIQLNDILRLYHYDLKP